MDQNSTPTAPPRNPRRDWFAFDRSDRWGMGILLALTVVITAATSIMVPVLRWMAGDGDGAPWTADRLKAALEGYRVEHASLRFDPEARNLRHTHVSPAVEGDALRVEQMLVDPDMVNDWVAEFRVDLPASREAQRPVLALTRLGSLA